MKNIYTERLEHIIQNMKAELDTGNTSISLLEYETWIECLKKVYPESKLIETQVYLPHTKIPSYSDIREIMKMAETKQYPTWFIQPRFTGQCLALAFEKGEYKAMYAVGDNGLTETEIIKVLGIPGKIGDFTGHIIGTLFEEYEGTTSFLAYDIHTKLSFQEKMALLEKSGFVVAEYVLFPTEKIPTVPSHKLETSLRNYLSSALEKGLLVDGVVIVCDESTRVALEFH